jgi:uncharacterized protein
MEIIEDRNLIRRLVEERSEENRRFRESLEGELRKRSGELNRLVDEIAREVEGVIDCRGCGECCRGLDISVTGEDIDRLSRRLGMTPAEFRERHTRFDEEGDPEIPSVPCPFLRGNLCSVYEDRPGTCRSFPHLHRDICERIHQLDRNAAKCPVVFNVLEELKRRMGWTSGVASMSQR